MNILKQGSQKLTKLAQARQTGPARYTGSRKPAEALDVSRATAVRHWTYARARLRDAVSAEKRLPWLRRARPKNRTSA
jgi:hypothetical protein